MKDEDLYKKAEYHKDMVSVRPHHEFANVDFIAGGLWMKEEMMKDAVEGISCTYSNKSGTFLHIKNGLDTKDGDKVKIIIVKTEQQ